MLLFPFLWGYFIKLKNTKKSDTAKNHLFLSVRACRPLNTFVSSIHTFCYFFFSNPFTSLSKSESICWVGLNGLYSFPRLRVTISILETATSSHSPQANSHALSLSAIFLLWLALTDIFVKVYVRLPYFLVFCHTIFSLGISAF